MTELLPMEQAEALRASLLEYLATTFNLVEADTDAAFQDFLGDREHGIFRGPYVRLRLPFAPAPDGWQDALDTLPSITPYGHQARAFERLSTKVHHRPLPTVVTTGTGSGKTEAFTVPILDHIARANARGVRGTKALILYPMNALANDQASRLAQDIVSTPAYAGITAALYTGEVSDAGRTRVSESGLITDRRVIRETPPDVILTNYKMLDQLLLRPLDAQIWKESATSLTYLVIDEFHTYDGAQGTDVAMLLRRLGATLKSYWKEDDPDLTDDDWARPLGRVTPVATSATLGDKGDPTAMLSFAETVTGEDIEQDAVITETRLTAEQWAGDASAAASARGLVPVRVNRLVIQEVMAELRNRFAPADASGRPAPLSIGAAPTTAARILFEHLYEATDTNDGTGPDLNGDDLADLLTLAKAHPLIRHLLDETAEAVDLRELANRLFPDQRTRADRTSSPAAFLTVVFSVLSHLRAVCGRAAPSLDAHLWIRELSRVDRTIGADNAGFRWGDDGVVTAVDDSTAQAFPAVYCRHCGRSGWGVLLAQTGTSLEATDTNIRREHLGRNQRFRALLHAPNEIAAAANNQIQLHNLRWLDVSERRLTVEAPEVSQVEAGTAVPVLAQVGEDAGKASVDDVCPSCEANDAIRFLGSAIATQLSIALGSVFGTPHLDDAEKKALVFTDSVQDASHRAGFVASRSHTLTLRSVMGDHIGTDPVDLVALTNEMLTDAGSDPRRRYRLLPPDLAERERFIEFWQEPESRSLTVRRRAERRLRLDVLLEFGLRTNVGRTLEATTSVAVGMLMTDAQLAAAARRAIETVLETTGTEQLLPPDEPTLVRWVRAVLAHMRLGGAIDHPWFTKYRQHDGNRWFLTGGRAREEGMPWFGRGTSAPIFPFHGGAATSAELEPIASRRGWYAGWSAKCLGYGTDVGASMSKALFTELARRDIVGSLTSPSGMTTYHLDPSTIVVQDADPSDAWNGKLAVACDTCGAITRGLPVFTAALDDGPCLVHRCPGRLQPVRQGSNYYQRLYATPDPRRIIAREHTSMLEPDERLRYEAQFKASDPAPDAPNVLVATPTLEMGIDIGDLSAVMLSSMPRNVASYLQRVGRAGRLTGNSLAVAFIAARGTELPAFSQPLRTINGAVRPPVTYLDAEEILRRQYLAFAADRLTLQGHAAHGSIRTAHDVLATSAPGSFLADLIRTAESTEVMTAFLAGFATLAPETTERLRGWADPVGAPASSTLATRCHQASQDWNSQIEQLSHRIAEIDAALAELAERAKSPAATSEDEDAYRTSLAARRQAANLRGGLRNQPWISALEAAGLLPNYTLIDDSVTLDVSLTWFDPENDEFREDPFTLERASERALRDFAPGATFYSRGYAVDVDAIDFSRTPHHIRTWACCGSCGYVHDLAEGAAPPRCPRCDKPEIADAAQRLDTIELTHVSSVMRREQATIDDRSDQRRQESFTVATLADIDPSRASSWFVEGTSFGARYQREATIRWVNLGPASKGGTTTTLAGYSTAAPLFRICPTCGKLDSASGRNEARDHRPWCRQRKAVTEPTRAVALTRTMHTEALVLRLPVELTTGDQFAVPSLRAAILLALEIRLGGPPDHIDIAVISDPTASSGQNPPALLIYDKVPGGTGYLAELADPAATWALLRAGHKALAECDCAAADDPRLACENCLLPYAFPGQLTMTSRTAADRTLRVLLAPDTPAGDPVPEISPWRTNSTEPEAPDAESYLEQHLRKALRERLQTLGAAIREQPTHRGVSWRITMPDGLVWRLDPQVDLHGCRPDFFLTCVDPTIPKTAIFADGWRYHASPGINNLAEDARKRAELRDAGYYVLSLTAADLEPGTYQVPWLDQATREDLIAHAQLSPHALDRLTRPGLDLLVDWIKAPDPDHRRALAAWLPLMLIASSWSTEAAADADLAATAQACLAAGPEEAASLLAADGSQASPAHLTGIYATDTVAVVTQVMDTTGAQSRLVVALDDQRVGLDHAGAWRAWLHLSNHLAFRDEPTVLTVSSLLGSTGTVDLNLAADGEIPDRWKPVLEDATETERRHLVSLIGRDSSLPVPVIGEEIGDGIPLGPTWIDLNLTVVEDDVSAEDRAEIESLGWRIVAADAAAIHEALLAATTTKEN